MYIIKLLILSIYSANFTRKNNSICNFYRSLSWNNEKLLIFQMFVVQSLLESEMSHSHTYIIKEPYSPSLRHLNYIKKKFYKTSGLTVEIAQKFTAHQPQQRPYIEFHLVLRQFDA